MNLVGSSWVRISTMPPLASVTSLSLIKAPPRTQCPQTQDPKYRMTGGFFFDSFHLALVPFPLDSPLLLCPQLFTFVSVVYVCAWFMWLYHAIPHFIPLRQDLSLNWGLHFLRVEAKQKQFSCLSAPELPWQPCVEQPAWCVGVGIQTLILMITQQSTLNCWACLQLQHCSFCVLLLFNPSHLSWVFCWLYSTVTNT